MDFSNQSNDMHDGMTPPQQPMQTPPSMQGQGYGQMPPPGNGAPLPPKNSKKKWIAFFSVIGILLLSVIISFTSSFFSEDTSTFYSSGEANVRVIDINGEIETAGDTYNQGFVDEMIATAAHDEDNVAILLLLNTPGGSVYESDETYLKLMQYKEQTGRPVYAYCESMCASGGYYIAASADQICANRNSLIGAIGVICGQFVDATELLDNIGIKITTPHSGANKLMGNMSEPPTQEQIDIMQTICDEAYEQFVGCVAKGRGMDTAEVKKLADGRIYSAKQCVDNGLIDRVGTIEEFDAMIKKELGGDIVFYHEVYKKDLMDRLYESIHTFVGEKHASTELSETLEILDKLTISEPMYLYMR